MASQLKVAVEAALKQVRRAKDCNCTKKEWSRLHGCESRLALVNGKHNANTHAKKKKKRKKKGS